MIKQDLKGYFVSLVKKIFCIIKKDNSPDPVFPQEESTIHQEPFFSQWVTYGEHLGHISDERAEVVFTNHEKGISRVIVDNDGHICDCPAIKNPEIVVGYLDGKELPPPIVRFRVEFERLENDYMMRWQIQPDGSYWTDIDGHEVTDGEEVILYTYLNDCGRFKSSFRIYKVGQTKYFGTDLEEKAAEKIFEKKLEHYLLCAIDYFIDMIQKKGPDSMEYNLLGTENVGVMGFVKSYQGEGKYALLVGVKKKGSDKLWQHYLLSGYSKEEILQFLKEEETRQMIQHSMKRLIERVNRD